MSTSHTGGDPAAIGAGDRELVDGDVVGEYVVRDLLGKGGFGTVYRAQHPVIGKQVAIKVLSRRYSSDEAIVRRFVDEARAVNQIRHRNIIDIFSFGQLADGRHYYVMEYLDGTPLDRYLEEHGVLRLEEALPILRAIARALDAAHAKGIAHRDLKPENIVLSFDDEGNIFPKLLDFGIAKLTSPDEERAHRTGTGVPLGTPYYMSPEQCRGRDVDQRTDLYSFGVLTFRLLTGDYPFHGELIEILHKHMHEEPPRASSINPALTDDIDAAIAAMMHKDPARRPPSVISAVVALHGETTSPTPIQTGPDLRPSGRGPVARRGAVQTADTLAAATGDTMVSASTIPPVTKARSSRVPIVLGLVLVVASALGVFAWLQTRKPAVTEPATSRSMPAPAGGAAPAAGSAAPAPASASASDAAAGTAPASASAAAAAGTAPASAPASAAAGAVPAPGAAPAGGSAAPAPAAAPKTVVITITGAPEGAEVKVSGASRGVVPSVELEYGTSLTVLSLYADGYVPASKPITPDHDQEIAIPMKKKPRDATTNRARPSKDDIPHEIKGLTDQ